MRMPLRAMMPALGLVALVVVSGCAPAEEPIEVAPRESLDLTIGALVPDTGIVATWGPSTRAAVALAVTDVNDAATTLTVAAEIRDVADSSTDAGVNAVNELLELPVDAFVGPLTDGVSRKVLDSIVDAGLPVISPANSAPDFTQYDDDGLYWRTSAPCTLEASVFAQRVADSGADSVGILTQEGSCGDQLPKAVRIGLERLGVEVAAEVSLDDGASVDQAVAEFVAADPDVIAVVSPQAKDTITPLSNAGFAGNQLFFAGLAPGNYSADFPEATLLGATATRPGPDYASLETFTSRLLEVDPAITQFRHSAETYDAVVLLALAAYQANSTDGPAMAAALAEVSGTSGEGTACTSFKACAAAILAGEEADYEGISGSITFDDAGDPQGASIGVFVANRDGVFSRVE